jgi:hypothetical protein
MNVYEKSKFIFNYLYYVCFSGVKESSKTEDCFSHLQEEYKYVCYSWKNKR